MSRLLPLFSLNLIIASIPLRTLAEGNIIFLVKYEIRTTGATSLVGWIVKVQDYKNQLKYDRESSRGKTKK